MKFFDVKDRLPPEDAIVLVRGWGEAKKHFVWAFGEYVIEDAAGWWRHHDVHCPYETKLWFKPIAWAHLPKPLTTGKQRE